MTPLLWPPPQRVALDGPTAASPTRVAPETAVGPCGLPAEGYRIHISDEAVAVDASDEAGARHAQHTLGQLALGYGARLPTGVIEDWPALGTRGAMLDVSRARVPTVATLTALIDRLAAFKVNHLELYFEHTFAYTGHDDVWADASPFTADNLRTLDIHAASRGVELTANQNCLGHMERWLRHDRYRSLALSPDGFTTPWGATVPAMTMDPSEPGALGLARDLLGQLVPTLRSRRVHIGLDEPWELPPERIREWATYLAALRAAPETAARQLLVWGDVPSRHPELLAAVPDGVTVCEWGYEAGHPFAERAEALAAAGVEFWLCPGTSSWNSVAGRWSNALSNIAEAADAAMTNGGEGVLVTDWGDNGHLQHLSVAEPLMVWAAGCAWNPAACDPGGFPAVVDALVMHDSSARLGGALAGLGDAHLLVAPQLVNQSILTAALYRPSVRLGSSRRTAGLTVGDLERVGAVVNTARDDTTAATLDRADAAIVTDEVLATANLIGLLVDDAVARVGGDGTALGMSASTRAALDIRLAAISEQHQLVWLARNRDGGLSESLAVLDRLRATYAAV